MPLQRVREGATLHEGLSWVLVGHFLNITSFKLRTEGQEYYLQFAYHENEDQRC